jgi:hypothetical protein
LLLVNSDESYLNLNPIKTNMKINILRLAAVFVIASLFATTAMAQSVQTSNSGDNTLYQIDRGVFTMNDAITLTHSESFDILAGNSVACASAADDPPQRTGPQSFYRVFDLDDYSEIDGAFEVMTFSFGVESASTNYPVTLKIHTLEGSFITSNLTQIESQEFTITPEMTGTFVEVNFDIAPLVPEGSTIVAELLYSDGFEFGGALFVGSNGFGETGSTYLRADNCGIEQPTSTSAIGFPQVQWVMSLTGEVFEAPELGPFSLISPENGATLNLSNDNSEILTIQWEPSENANSYEFVADLPGSNFANPLITLDADAFGTATSLTTPANALYNILLDAGVPDEVITEAEWTVFANAAGARLRADEVWTINLNMNATDTSIDDPENPFRFELSQNYPNPFNPTTSINFTIPEASDVTLEVFNLQGQRVASLVNSTLSAGFHSVSFNAENLSSGIYLYRINAGSFSQTNKMMLVK